MLDNILRVFVLLLAAVMVLFILFWLTSISGCIRSNVEVKCLYFGVGDVYLVEKHTWLKSIAHSTYKMPLRKHLIIVKKGLPAAIMRSLAGAVTGYSVDKI